MKILIDHGSPQLANMGDLAMLQVAVKRFRELFNKEGHPVEFAITSDLTQEELTDKLITVLGDSKVTVVNKLKKNRYTAIKRRGSYYFFGHEAAYDQNLNEAMDDCHLVVSAGGGYFVNDFIFTASSVIDTLALAITKNIPTAILGHGFGELTKGKSKVKDPAYKHKKELDTKFKRWLPQVNLIFVRENLFSTPVLYKYGVKSENIRLTGDDAIELAYNSKREESDSKFNIGFNLRTSTYSGITDNKSISLLRDELLDFANRKSGATPKTQVKFEILPISLVKHESDITSGKYVIDLQLQRRLAKKSSEYTPDVVIQAASTCRIVITASYHAAVFALSQGIPVIALIKSKYYEEKFLGLQKEFNAYPKVNGFNGIELINLPDIKSPPQYNFGRPLTLSEPEIEFKLKFSTLLNELWDHSDIYQEPLLKCANRQIVMGKAAYNEIIQLVLNKHV
jgi:colanic acid/amylovoran biosynthesis protein